MATINNPKMREAFRDQVLQHISTIPLAADDNYFKTSTVLAAQTTTLAAASMTKSYTPTTPVVPVLVIVNDVASGETSWTSVAATMVGLDQFGRRVAETVAAVDSSDTWTATWTTAFATLISVSFTITGGTAADGSDTYILGYAKTYGLGVKIGASADVIVHNFNGATDAGTISTVNHTYVVAGTPDAAKILEFWIRSSAYE